MQNRTYYKVKKYEVKIELYNVKYRGKTDKGS